MYCFTDLDSGEMPCAMLLFSCHPVDMYMCVSSVQVFHLSGFVHMCMCTFTILVSLAILRYVNKKENAA